MSKERRARVDSAQGVHEAIAAANRPVPIPAGVELDELEASIFDDVVAELAKSELTAHRVRLCAMIASDLARMQRSNEAVAQQGSVIFNAQGNARVNPHVRVADQALRSALAMRRSLGITARALNGGDTRNVAIRRQHNLSNEALLDDMDDEDLLARPSGSPSDRRDH
jgi:phage terminase small subunit